MTQQIKFRGFRTDGKGWVDGFYVYRPDGKHLIYWQPFPESTNNTYHEIHPSSLGMFTGRTDKNGKEIYGAIGDKGGDVSFVLGVETIVKFGSFDFDVYEKNETYIYKCTGFYLKQYFQNELLPIVAMNESNASGLEIIGNQWGVE